jgi:hypothetical protein
MGDYLRPTRLDEALQALTRRRTVLAGGTDFYPARVGRAIDEDILDITAIDELRGISETAEGWRSSWSPSVSASRPMRRGAASSSSGRDAIS